MERVLSRPTHLPLRSRIQIHIFAYFHQLMVDEHRQNLMPELYWSKINLFSFYSENVERYHRLLPTQFHSSIMLLASITFFCLGFRCTFFRLGVSCWVVSTVAHITLVHKCWHQRFIILKVSYQVDFVRRLCYCRDYDLYYFYLIKWN